LTEDLNIPACVGSTILTSIQWLVLAKARRLARWEGDVMESEPENELEIIYAQGLNEEDIAQFAGLFRQDFPEIQTSQTYIVFASGDGFEQAVLTLTVESVAVKVLTNLIVKGGAKVWERLSRALRKGRAGYGEGSPPALAITVRRADAEVQFTIWPTLAPEVIPEVIKSIPALLESIPESQCAQVDYGWPDPGWREPFELSDAGYDRVREDLARHKRRRRRRRAR
jgi:hypothetical protein